MADTLSNLLLVPSSALAQTAWVSVGQNMGRKKFKNIHLYNRRDPGLSFWLDVSGNSGRGFVGNGNAAASGRSGAGKSVISARVYLAYNMYPRDFFGLGTAMICRNSLQAMGSYQHLIYLGIIEMSVTIFFAVLVCAEIRIPGILYFYSDQMDDTWNRRGILVSEENEKNDAKR